MSEQTTITLLFALLRSALLGTPLGEAEQGADTPDRRRELLALAKQQDMAHLLVWGMRKSGWIPPEEDVGNAVLKAVYRYEQLTYEYDNLCGALERAGIPFLPLKGAILRAYYPEGWMRTSCDVDVLVREEDRERAQTVLMETCGYTYNKKESHDVSLYAPGGMHVELHYALVEEGLARDASTVLDSVWEDARVTEGYAFRYEMSDAMFYFYHIAHMAKHFENGGCGIKPFIDLWFLDGLAWADREGRRTLLERGGLRTFAEAAGRLSRIWADGGDYDPVSRQMEAYVLQGGVYGTGENRVAVQQQKKGGKLRYALSRIFLPYEKIRYHYPILEKHRWLTPLMEVRRWCKLVFCGHLRRSVGELSYNGGITAEKARQTRQFLQDIGL